MHCSLMKSAALVVVLCAAIELIWAKPAQPAAEAGAKKRFGHSMDGFQEGGLRDNNMYDWNSGYFKRMDGKRTLESSDNGLGSPAFNNYFQDWRNTFGRNYRSFGGNRVHNFGDHFDDGLQNWMAERTKRSARDAEGYGA